MDRRYAAPPAPAPQQPSLDAETVDGHLPPLRQLFPEHMRVDGEGQPYAQPHAGGQRPQTAQGQSVTSSQSLYPYAHSLHPSLQPIQNVSQTGANPVGDSKYDCPYCGKHFDRPSSVKIHVTSHTGEKPFVCAFPGCGRRFSVNSNMRRHLRTHAPHPGSSQDTGSLSADEEEIRPRSGHMPLQAAQQQHYTNYPVGYSPSMQQQPPGYLQQQQPLAAQQANPSMQGYPAHAYQQQAYAQQQRYAYSTDAMSSQQWQSQQPGPPGAGGYMRYQR